MEKAIIDLNSRHLAFYMPPGTGKTSLEQEIKSKAPHIKVFDTDHVVYAWHGDIRQDFITVMKPNYNLILTNRWSLDSIDVGFFPSLGRLKLNLQRADDIIDLAFRIGLVKSYDQLAMAMSVNYPIKVLTNDITVDSSGKLTIYYNKLNQI